MVTNNSNNNAIPTTDRQGVSNRDNGRYNYSTADLLQHGFRYRKTNAVGIKKGSPIDKTIILVKAYSRRPISRKIETFCRSLDENNTGSQNFGHSKRIQNSISFKTFPVKISSQPIVIPEGEELLNLKVKEMLKKEANRKIQPSKGEFVSNLFLVKNRMGAKDQ